MLQAKSRIFLFILSILIWQSVGPLFADSGVSAAARVPGEILVDLRDSATEDDVRELQNRYGIELRFNSPLSERQRLYLVSLPDSRVSEMVSLLSSDPLVEAAEPEYLYTAFSLPNDPLYKYQWHMHQINVAQAWRFSKGEGVTVAVIDTGVAYENYQHFHRVEDLEGTRFVPGYNFVNNTTHANDDHGHGTHVAGTIAQATDNSDH
ncbi:MAG: S8 family serine peptidase [Armatimonadetes bacterium]|nr:S8 family serine peptidase [Armatimonadota bacterium]